MADSPILTDPLKKSKKKKKNQKFSIEFNTRPPKPMRDFLKMFGVKIK